MTENKAGAVATQLLHVERPDYAATISGPLSGKFRMEWHDHTVNQWSAEFDTFAAALEGLARLESGCAVDLGDGVEVETEQHEHAWQLTENGYSRSWSTEVVGADEVSFTVPEFTGRVVLARYGGSEDFSDNGDGQMFLECLGCGQTIDVADDNEEWHIEYL